MLIGIGLMTKLMRRVGNNPFASAKTRARNLLLRLQEEGYQVSQITPQPEAFNPLHASLEASDPTPSPMTPRQLYKTNQFQALHELKRSRKKSYAAMGFTPDEIDTILSHT